MSYPEYYNILKVSPEASPEEIKKAYHKLAKKLHPDLNKNDKQSEEQLKKVNEAYEVLKDLAKRAEYDYFGKQALEAQQKNNDITPTNEASFKKSVKKEAPMGKFRKTLHYTTLIINQLALLTVIIGYSWLYYINIDKEEPHNVFKTLNNTADYLIQKVPEKVSAGHKLVKETYNNSSLPKKLALKLVKKGNPELLDAMQSVLDMNEYDELLENSPNAAMTKYLLNLPHDENDLLQNGDKALLEAVKRNDADSVQLLLEAGIVPHKLKELLNLTENSTIKNLLTMYYKKQMLPKKQIKWGKNKEQ